MRYDFVPSLFALKLVACLCLAAAGTSSCSHLPAVGECVRQPANDDGTPGPSCEQEPSAPRSASHIDRLDRAPRGAR